MCLGTWPRAGQLHLAWKGAGDLRFREGGETPPNTHQRKVDKKDFLWQTEVATNQTPGESPDE
jgi:hypothetical protein